MDIFTIFLIFVIVFSAIIHEYSHGWVADQLGDPTARYAGRLTLNPIPHIDLFGSILLPLLLTITGTGLFFAYAKPVPYNPYNLKNQKWGPALVAIGGPASNFFLAFIFGLIIQFAPLGQMLPFVSVIVFANVMLGTFNLVPIPPLDGSKVLFAIFPDSLERYKDMLQRYGFIFLVVFIMFFSPILIPIVRFIYNVFTAGMGYPLI